MNNKSIYLVTTPIKEIFPQDVKEAIGFIGNKNYDYLKSLNPKASEIIDIKSSWTNKDKLISSNRYLSKLEIKFFKELISAFNKVFDTNYTEDYWNIFLRPSAFSIMTFLFERWSTIEDSCNSFNVISTNFSAENHKQFVSDDIGDLNLKVCDSDIFNHFIYQEILKFKKIDYFQSKVKIENLNLVIKNKENISLKYLKKIKIKNFIYLCKLLVKEIHNQYSILRSNNKNFVFISNRVSNQKLKDEICNLFSKKFFSLKIKTSKKKFKYDQDFRNKLEKNFNFKPSNEFEFFLKDFFFKLLPISFVEKYQTIKKENENYKKKFIFQVGFLLQDQMYGNESNELEWIAHNAFNKKEIIYLQNGGGPLTARYFSISEIIKKVTRKNLTFGSSDNIKDNLFGVGLYRFPNKKIETNDNGNIIYTMFTPYGYCSEVSSVVPINNEWVDYIDAQIKLLNILPEEITKKIVIRMKKRHPINSPFKDYFGFQQKLKKKFPNIKHDDYTKPLQNLIQNSRLVIATLDTTTMLETLSLNIPTLIMLDLKKFQITEDAKEYYQKLHDVGIITYTPEETQKRIIEIFANISLWWNDANVQLARENFCQKFAFHPVNQEKFFIKKLSKIL